MASETVDPIDWSHPLPDGQYPMNTSCIVKIGADQPQPGFDLATLQPSACDANHLDYAATQGISGSGYARFIVDGPVIVLGLTGKSLSAV